MAKCKSCGAPVVWRETPRGKWLPLDEGMIPYKADTKGTDVLVNDSGEVIRCRLSFDGAPDGMARMPHWATCPNADKHRRK